MDHGTVPLAPSEHDGVDVSPLDRVSAVPCDMSTLFIWRLPASRPKERLPNGAPSKSSSLAPRQPSSALIESSHDEGCLLGIFHQQELVRGVSKCRRPIPRAQIVLIDVGVVLPICAKRVVNIFWRLGWRVRGICSSAISMWVMLHAEFLCLAPCSLAIPDVLEAACLIERWVVTGQGVSRSGREFL
jgi:hypothetical protein